MAADHQPGAPRCPLGKLIPDTIDTESLKHDAWSLHHILVVSADDPRINWIERQILQAIGERLFGRVRYGR